MAGVYRAEDVLIDLKPLVERSGAQLVLANGRVVEIDSQTAKHLKGVAPGINLPLLHDQRLIDQCIGRIRKPRQQA